MTTQLATRFGKGTQILRAPAGQWLTEDEMRARLPAIFATDAHNSRSDRYTYIPTLDIVRGLEGEGFKPTFACQAATRNEDMRGHTKHMLRFRKDFAVDLKTPDFPEIVMVNSHGGQSSAQLFGGWFRLVCMNGMVVSNGNETEEIRVKHKGDVVGEIIEGAYRVVGELAPVKDRVDAFKALTLSREESNILAEEAIRLRFDLEDGERLPVTPEQMLRARRFEDGGNTLWSAFNRVQENATRGGLHGRTIDANGRRRNMTTRDVNGIDQNVRLNRSLWRLAERMAELKGEGPAPRVIEAEFRDA